jgi:hypothetical protein
VYQERRLLHSTMSNTMVLTAGNYHCRGKGTVSMSTEQVYSRTPELMEHQHYHFLTLPLLHEKVPPVFLYLQMW